MSLSDQWRINRSQLLEFELLSILQGVKTAVGSISDLGEDVVLRDGQSHNRDKETIVIDSKKIFSSKTYPVSGDCVDIIIGQAAHEAAHSASDFISSKEWIEALEYNGITSDHDAFNRHEFWLLAEELVADSWIRRNFPVQSKYLNIARQDSLGKKFDNWDHILKTWLNTAVYGQIREDSKIPEWQKPIWTILDATTASLEKIPMNRSDRKDMLVSVFSTIIKLLKVEQSKQAGQSEIGASSDDIKRIKKALGKSATIKIGSTEYSNEVSLEPTDKSKLVDPLHSKIKNDSKKRLTTNEKSIIEDVYELIETGADDLTQLMEDALKTAGVWDTGKSATIWSNSSDPVDTSGVSEQYRKQAQLLTRIKNEKRIKTERYKKEGRIDRRRLARYKTSTTIRKVSKLKPFQKLHGVILVDGSGSMNSNIGVFEACKAISIIIPTMDVVIYQSKGYSESIVDLKLVNHSNKWHKPSPNGGTPSGRALLGTLVKYPESLIFHFTDGDPNRDIEPNQVFDMMEQQFPMAKIVNLINRNSPSQWYKNTAQVKNITVPNLDNFGEILSEQIGPWIKSGVI